jgi:thiamine kinase-like enzyme
MEEKDIEKEITKNVKIYFYQNKLKETLNEDRISFEFERLGGMCNKNYLVTIKEKTTGKKVFQFVYKKFGIIQKSGDHLLESYIIEYLSKEGIGPKLYLEKKNYRLMEYIPETRHIDKEILFDERILNQLSLILNTYNHFTSTFIYHINDNKIEIEPLKVKDDYNTYGNDNINVTKTFYDNITNVIYKKAKNSFNKFKKEFYEKIPLKGNEESHAIVTKFKNYLDNFSDNLNKYYPKEGFLVMCHNDVNRYNFIQKISDGKLYCLDHEYASLNLPGYDIADYFNETNFHFVPNYYFSFEDINYDKYFCIYKIYIQKTIESHDFLNNNIKGKEFIENITSKKYYLQLHQIINYFWFLCCIAHLDFQLWYTKKKESFNIAKDLIKFYEFGLKQLKE